VLHQSDITTSRIGSAKAVVAVRKRRINGIFIACQIVAMFVKNVAAATIYVRSRI